MEEINQNLNLFISNNIDKAINRQQELLLKGNYQTSLPIYNSPQILDFDEPMRILKRGLKEYGLWDDEKYEKEEIIPMNMPTFQDEEGNLYWVSKITKIQNIDCFLNEIKGPEIVKEKEESCQENSSNTAPESETKSVGDIKFEKGKRFSKKNDSGKFHTSFSIDASKDLY